MMENDEYETMKAFYFPEVKNQMNNNDNMNYDYIFNTKKFLKKYIYRGFYLIYK